jgi:hypothetical protein
MHAAGNTQATTRRGLSRSSTDKETDVANALHTSVKKLFLDADLDLLVATIKLSLCDTANHAMDAANDNFADDVEAAFEETATLDNKTTTGGAFDDTDNGTWPAASGDPCEYVEMWCDTGGASSTDPLIAAYDTFASGMPVTLNGGDVTFTVHASGFFSI